MKILKYIGILFLTITACKDADEIPFAGRETYMVFYESDQNLLGVSAKEIDGGFIILSNKISLAETNGLLTKTDKTGKIVEEIELPNAVFKGLAIGNNGYFAIGDSIKITASDTVPVADLIVSSMILYKIDLSGKTIINKRVSADRKSKRNITDIRGNALTLNMNNQLIVLGTYEEGFTQTTIKPFVAAFNQETLDTIWIKKYNVIARDYVNSKSVQSTYTGHVVWASGILRESGDFRNSYLSIPYVKENSVFENNDLLGETTDQQYTANDIQPNVAPAFGFGVIGSYATTDGTKSNIFFSRVDQFGNFISTSTKYFDGVIGNPLEDKTTSQSEDKGQALAATNDGGFVLAGTMSTTPELGNGGTDILLIKVDADGNVQWKRYYGGSGDESVGSIIETSDGGLLLCGTRVLGGLGSTFIMKLNSDGELKD